MNKDDRKGGELENLLWEKQIQKTDRKKMEEVIQQKNLLRPWMRKSGYKTGTETKVTLLRLSAKIK